MGRIGCPRGFGWLKRPSAKLCLPIHALLAMGLVGCLNDYGCLRAMGDYERWMPAIDSLSRVRRILRRAAISESSHLSYSPPLDSSRRRVGRHRCRRGRAQLPIALSLVARQSAGRNIQLRSDSGDASQHPSIKRHCAFATEQRATRGISGHTVVCRASAAVETTTKSECHNRPIGTGSVAKSLLSHALRHLSRHSIGKGGNIKDRPGTLRNPPGSLSGSTGHSPQEQSVAGYTLTRMA
jgi:hypothetical protein